MSQTQRLRTRTAGEGDFGHQTHGRFGTTDGGPTSVGYRRHFRWHRRRDHRQPGGTHQPISDDVRCAPKDNEMSIILEKKKSPAKYNLPAIYTNKLGYSNYIDHLWVSDASNPRERESSILRFSLYLHILERKKGRYAAFTFFSRNRVLFPGTPIYNLRAEGKLSILFTGSYDRALQEEEL